VLPELSVIDLIGFKNVRKYNLEKEQKYNEEVFLSSSRLKMIGRSALVIAL